jgi:hypothetical protein
MAMNHRWLAYAGVEAFVAPSSPSLPPMNNNTNNSSTASSSSLLSSLTATVGTATNALHGHTHGNTSLGSSTTVTGTSASSGRSLVDYLPSASDAKETVDHTIDYSMTSLNNEPLSYVIYHVMGI